MNEPKLRAREPMDLYELIRLLKPLDDYTVLVDSSTADKNYLDFYSFQGGEITMLSTHPRPQSIRASQFAKGLSEGTFLRNEVYIFKSEQNRAYPIIDFKSDHFNRVLTLYTADPSIEIFG